MEIAYIGMGANIPSSAGPPEVTLVEALRRLASLGQLAGASSLYSTAPVGYADQPRFVNAVVALATHLSARQVLEGLLCIERAFGRDRSSGIQNGPRTLDLDLLLLGDEVIHEDGLDVPHPRLAERAFVLVPLNEIAPQLVIVTHGKSVKELLQILRRGLTNSSNAILPLQSDVWRSGSCGVDSLRADEPDAHRDR
jgi:2-amino-4-hydroxy-6-hydroxymethyldihydropteridine diphosphokinase